MKLEAEFWKRIELRVKWRGGGGDASLSTDVGFISSFFDSSHLRPENCQSTNQ